MTYLISRRFVMNKFTVMVSMFLVGFLFTGCSQKGTMGVVDQGFIFGEQKKSLVAPPSKNTGAVKGTTGETIVETDVPIVKPSPDLTLF